MTTQSLHIALSAAYPEIQTVEERFTMLLVTVKDGHVMRICDADVAIMNDTM